MRKKVLNITVLIEVKTILRCLTIWVCVPKGIVERVGILVPGLRIGGVLRYDLRVRTREPPLRRREVPGSKVIQSRLAGVIPQLACKEQPRLRRYCRVAARPSTCSRWNLLSERQVIVASRGHGNAARVGHYPCAP